MLLDDVNGLHQQLAILDMKFSQSLPGQLREIADGCRRLLAGAVAAADLEALHRKIHRLSGSGTSFGSPEISEAALDLERSIKGELAGRRADSEKISVELSALRAAVERRLAGEGKRPGV